ncbi:glucan endo-1,3-beta-glucosidase-like [Vicia villosa]|uniref:glucan endo-1,3-beta-glucosidase-like n=1 Tax=Vicia villosa TaxID=3911 RepID=UPI00273C3D66|nr:glucan endo-1,3-beta-glucosidase-like [Vicia villosa]
MTKYSISSIIIFISMLIAGGNGMITMNGPDSWCIAKPSASLEELNYNLIHACITHNCSMIEKGEECYEPDTLYSHASRAMNRFYADHGKDEFFCNVFFRNSGLIVLSDPSYGSCKYD